MKAHLPTLLLLLLSAFAGIDIFANTLTVTKVEDTNDGVCDADCSLREAVAAANADDTIIFSTLFSTPQSITLTLGQIGITRNLNITGPGRDLLAISGNDASRIFYISGSTVRIAGMKLVNARLTSPTDNKGAAVYAVDSALTISNMIFTNNYTRFVSNGFVFGYGSGVFSENGSLTVTESIFSDNTAADGSGSGHGGGTIAAGGTALIVDSTIVNNAGIGIVTDNQTVVQNSNVSGNSMRGILCDNDCSIIQSTVSRNRDGGVSTNDSGSAIVVDHSIISDNESIQSFGRAGGGVISFGMATIRNSVVTNNSCTGQGGGILNASRMIVANSAITNNRSQFEGGGGISTTGDLYLINSTVSGNIADPGGGGGSTRGGGIYSQAFSFNERITLVNSTVANNQATGLGAGLRNDDGATATISNCLIAGNTEHTNPSDVSGTVASRGFNLIRSSFGSSGWLATDLLNIDPLLAPLGSNGGSTFTHALMPGSPAINGGSNSLAVDPTTNQPLLFDQRGFVRTVAGTVDIGAYESNISALPVYIRGRVTLIGGRAVSNARVTITDTLGHISYSQTNPFGYYRFLNLPAGTTLTVNVSHKLYNFEPQVVTLDQNRDDLNFVGR